MHIYRFKIIWAGIIGVTYVKKQLQIPSNNMKIQQKKISYTC